MPRNTPASLRVGENLTPLEDNKTFRSGKVSRMVAASIRLLREAHGMSQPDLEDKAGLSYGTISRIESGSRGRAISVDLAVTIAKVFHVDLNWLLTGQGVVPFGLDLDAPARAKPKPSPRTPAKTPRKTRRKPPPKRRSP